MPEEINRMVTDAITNCFFTTTGIDGRNLLGAGVAPDRIYFVGNNDDRFVAGERESAPLA